MRYLTSVHENQVDGFNKKTAGQAGLVCGDHVSRDVKISQSVDEAENCGSDSGNHRPLGR